MVVLDIAQARIDQWNSDKLPIYEPGLDEIVFEARGRNLFFSTEVEKHVGEADIIFISVNTPTKVRGVGAGAAADLTYWESAARTIAKACTSSKIIVEKSTVPVKTAEAVEKVLARNCVDKSIRFDILSNPEFLAEGTAIDDLKKPDRVLIGGRETESGLKAVATLKAVYERWVPSERVITANLWSAELSKLTANAFLAQRISSINAISALCEATGANVKQVSYAIGTDSRIGPKFLKSGPGFGGSCFQKDILNLVYLCRHFGLPEVADYWESVVHLNTWQQHRISRLIVQRLFGTVTGKKLAILGFAFKADTNDTREAPAIRIATDLLEEGAQLAIHDPKVESAQISRDLKLEPIAAESEAGPTAQALSGQGSWWSAASVEQAVAGADAVLILTEWSQYKSLNWLDLAQRMRRPAWVFDARSVVNPKEVRAAGLTLWRVGNGAG